MMPSRTSGGEIYLASYLGTGGKGRVGGGPGLGGYSHESLRSTRDMVMELAQREKMNDGLKSSLIK